MKKYLTKKQFHNYFSGITLKLCLVFSQLFLIPAFINQLGVEVYGEWLILTTIPNYLLLSDFGLTLTVTNEICRLISLKEYALQEKLYKSTLSLMSAIGIILLIIFLLLSLFFDFGKAFNLKSISNNYVTLILGGFMINVFFSLIFRVTIGYFKAINLFHKHEYFLALTLFLDFLLTLIILKFNWPLYYIPLFMAIIRLLMIIVLNILLKKISFYKFGFTTDFNLALKFIPVSLKLSFFQLGTALFIQGCTMLVGVILGAASVVVFNIIRTIVNSLKAFVGILYVPTMQEFTILISNNKRKLALVKMKKLILLVFYISLVSCLCIFLFRDFIFELWLRKPFKYDLLFLVFMLGSIIIHNIWNAASMLPMAINKMNEIAFYPILGISILIVQYFIIKKTGLVGLSFSFIIMDFIMLLLVANVNFKILNEKNKI